VLCLLVSLAFSRICCKPKRQGPSSARRDHGSRRSDGGAAYSSSRVASRIPDRAVGRAVAPSVVGTPVSFDQPPRSFGQPPSERRINDAMSKMLEMGFGYDQSLKALQVHNWSVERAAAALAATV